MIYIKVQVPTIKVCYQIIYIFYTCRAATVMENFSNTVFVINYQYFFSTVGAVWINNSKKLKITLLCI